jgi:hypothetical protein
MVHRLASRLVWVSLTALAAGLSACSSGDAGGDASLQEGTELPDEDLPPGDLSADDMKADGAWGHATECKPIPDLPRLVSPRIVVSLNGLTLHLTDPSSGYDKVFPIGPGAINQNPGELTYKESLSYYPILSSGGQDFEIKPSTSTACKIWWTDKATGEKLPVFAGLPFMSWSGAYAIHGPVDNYRAADGGTLRRGFVSHGCIRMRGADVLEVYARIRGIPKVPVHVQREPERLPDGTRVEVPDPWFGAECEQDSDCPYAGGVCKQNRFSGRGYCTQSCTSYCPDKVGYPTSYCVADPDDAAKGMCVLKEMPYNYGCRPQDHFVPQTRSRFNSTTSTATVCMPGSPGWVGDHCFVDGDCQPGNRCAGATGQEPGICTQACTAYCPDQPGFPTTACINEASLGGATCLRQCTPSSNASECPAGYVCDQRNRNGSTSKRNVCVPE